MRRLLVVVLLVGCGATATPVEVAHDEAPPDSPRETMALVMEAVTLRSEARAGQPPLYVEMAADGTIDGARCGATRLDPDGVLWRDDVVVARAAIVADRWQVLDASGADTGVVIGGDGISTDGGRGAAGFVVEPETGTLRSRDPEVPVVRFEPASAGPSLVTALFAMLLVCDDLGP